MTQDHNADIARLKSRIAALRQAAELPTAEPELLLDAALAELDAAIAMLDDTNDSAVERSSNGRALSGLHSDRRLLQAIFSCTPTPLYVVDHDGTVLRANAAASDVLGVGPGYATGRSLTALVEPAARAALRSQLAATIRTGTGTRLRCQLLASGGAVVYQFTILPLSVRGDTDRLLVAISQDGQPAPAAAAIPDGDTRNPRGAASKGKTRGRARPADGTADHARRLDLLAGAARLLLESTTVSESVLLQRAARLLSAALATWVIVDVRRRGQLQRHYVAGPDDPDSAGLAHAAAATEPGPGSVPAQVADSGQVLLLTHIDDEIALGTTAAGQPLTILLNAASVLSVPMNFGTTRYGVLTLVRRADHGQFGLADAALTEEIGALLGRALAARRTLRQRTETADALRATLLPPVLKPVPGVEIASAHLAPTRGREVGGDFYDVYPTPGGWGVAIGDVCGTGEDAAAATATARHAIRVLAHSDADPAQVLRGANDIMLAEEFGGRFVTASAAHLSWHGGRLRVVLASAGHPGPVHLRPDGRAQLVPGGGLPLGIFPDPEPTTRELRLAAGDVLFFYSDGLADARSPQAAYLEDSLADSLAQLAGRAAADVVTDMRKVVLDFCDNVLFDDLTMLVLRAGRAPARRPD